LRCTGRWERTPQGESRRGGWGWLLLGLCEEAGGATVVDGHEGEPTPDTTSTRGGRRPRVPAQEECLRDAKSGVARRLSHSRRLGMGGAGPAPACRCPSPCYRLASLPGEAGIIVGSAARPGVAARRSHRSQCSPGNQRWSRIAAACCRSGGRGLAIRLIVATGWDR
jgi:hypothetical protein